MAPRPFKDPVTGETLWLEDANEPDEYQAAPAFMSGDGEEAKQAADAAGPTFMDADWDDEEDVTTPPVWMQVLGGLPLLYDGESHMIYGEGGSGKSWTASVAIREVVRAGRLALILDYESNRATHRKRLKALGLSKAEAGRVAYWRVTGSLMSATGAQLLCWIDEYHPTLLVLDSVAKAMAACMMDESSPAHYGMWQQKVVEPWTSRRVTSILIDHIGHVSEDKRRSGRAPAARGASNKKDQVSGASYFFEATDPWSRSKNGQARMTTMKDREGGRAAGEVACVIDVTVEDDGARIEFSFTAPPQGSSSSTGAAAAPRYTWYMEHLSKWLGEQDEAQSASAVERYMLSIGKSPVYARTALAALVAEGFVQVEVGPRNAKLHVSVRPFSAAEDEAAAKPWEADPFAGR